MCGEAAPGYGQRRGRESGSHANSRRGEISHGNPDRLAQVLVFAVGPVVSADPLDRHAFAMPSRPVSHQPSALPTR